MLSELADSLDGCPFASVLTAEDNGGVLSVRALDLDVIRFLFLTVVIDCCRNFFEYCAV